MKKKFEINFDRTFTIPAKIIIEAQNEAEASLKLKKMLNEIGGCEVEECNKVIYISMINHVEDVIRFFPTEKEISIESIDSIGE